MGKKSKRTTSIDLNIYIDCIRTWWLLIVIVKFGQMNILTHRRNCDSVQGDNLLTCLRQCMQY